MTILTQEVLNTIDNEKIGISVSGGTDSAILLYMMAKEIDDNNYNLEICPYTLLDIPNTHWAAEDVINLVSDLFPNVAIRSTFTFPETSSVMMTEDDKNLNQRAFEKIVSSHGIKVVVRGITSIPPQKDLKPYNLLKDCPRDRSSISKTKMIYGKLIWKPFLFNDKKFIADMYIKYNRLDDLFPLTKSCVGSAKKTDNHSVPCKTCWWCREKYWAFGSYDLVTN